MSIYLKKDGSKVLSLSDKEFEDFDFNYGSAIFDPFRKTNQTDDLTQRGIIVYNYGDTVGIPMIGRSDPGR